MLEVNLLSLIFTFGVLAGDLVKVSGMVCLEQQQFDTCCPDLPSDLTSATIKNTLETIHYMVSLVMLINIYNSFNV